MPDNTVPTNELSVWLQAYTAPVLLGGAIAWFVLFSIAEFVVRATTARSRLVREAAPTTPEGEKPTTVQGFAFLAISTLHSATVACLMIYCLPSVLLADPPSGSEIDAQLRFGFFQSVGLQRIETLVYIAGYTYTSWALFEVLFFTLHWRTFGKVADMFHHVLFSVTGVYFMSEADACGFYAVVLMAMETSTPWLNIHLAFRGSGGEYRRMLGKVRVRLPQHPCWLLKVVLLLPDPMPSLFLLLLSSCAMIHPTGCWDCLFSHNALFQGRHSRRHISSVCRPCCVVAFLC